MGSRPLRAGLGEHGQEIEMKARGLINEARLRVARRTGVTVVRWPVREGVAAATRAMLTSRRIDLVVDVGANEGQFGSFLREDVGYSGAIVSFEPTPGAAVVLRERCANDPSWTVVESAVGAARGSATLTAFPDSKFNSLHHPTREGEERHEELRREVGHHEVDVIRLDAYEADWADYKHIFLKIDTQGHEHAAWEGAAGLRERIVLLQLESPVTSTYSGGWALADMVAGLAADGYRPTHFSTVAANYDGSTSEFDALFVRI